MLKYPHSAHLFLPSRGTTIITQKENKGEYNGMHCYDSNGSRQCNGAWYGGSWYWNTASDRDIYAHVFDQNGFRNGNGTPYRHTAAKASPNDDSWMANLPSNAICTSDNSTTSGNTLYSGTTIASQKSCNPNTLNAGNWYNYPAATAGSNNASVTSDTEILNSICPKGWRLPPNSGNKSFNTLIRTTYGLTATNSDSTLLSNSAMSFVRLGHYHYNFGSLNGRGSSSRYWSSTAYSSILSHYLLFGSGDLSPQNGYNRAYGMSIRCVSR